MCRILAHRGPDDAGFALFRYPGRNEHTHGPDGGYWSPFTDRDFRHQNNHLPVWGEAYFQDEIGKIGFNLGFAHRRLAVQDLTHYGHQPMPSSDRRLWITYNGEIYNFPELRDQLESEGYVFRTRSDTEVILYAWDAWGVESLQRLNGMFAFALYDGARQSLYLVRDRFGVKPLYYAQTKDAIVFGSEVKAVLASGMVPAQIDPESVADYFTFQNLYGSATLFHNVQLLRPGTYLQARPLTGETLQEKRYVDPLPAVDPSLADQSDIHEQVADTFQQAVRRQMISDVDVGAYLSGGMDSGSIVAVAAQQLPRLHTFTCGFDLTNVNGIEQGFDERQIAERLAYLAQTEHYAVVLHAGDMAAALEQVTWHMDDPRVGMCHQNWYVAKLASRFVKVCLAGAGGDELFGGYPWRYRPLLSASDFESFDQKNFAYWHRMLSTDELSQLFATDIQAHLPSRWQRYKNVLDEAPAYRDDLSREENMLQRALFFEFNTFMQGVLIVEDRISMAHSLESRVPFLDNDLANLAWSLPACLKVDMPAVLADNDQMMRTDAGKQVLRKAMEKFLPREFTQQRKQGFSPPDENWYRGPSMDYIKTVLLDPQSQQRPWFDQKFVTAKLDEHFSGGRNHRLLIWSLLSFEWLQRHLIDSVPTAK